MKRYEPDLEGLKEEYLDAVLRAALRLQDEAQIKSLVEEGGRELTEEEEKAARSAWERAIGKYERQQAEKEKRERREKRRSFLCRIAASAACILLLAAVGTTIAAAASEPVRESLNRLLLSFGEGHVDISLARIDTPDQEEGIIPGNDTVCVKAPEEWQGSFFPAYVPERFTFENISSDGRFVVYRNENGGFLTFSESHEHDVVSLDDEEAITYSIKTSSGKEVFIIEADKECMASWVEGEMLLTISCAEIKGGISSPDEIIKIIESVGFVR